ncbi:MAG: DUF433 domain-containing protein [Candidatus Wallbacteria bacterium]|nr:DUF433 domain-containing protein [Candidatus Wallbacteria bacterium]
MDWPTLPESPYLDIHAPDDVCVRGTRIDLSTVVDEYNNGRVPEQTVLDYPTLSAEAVYSLFGYYLGHQKLVDRYVACVRERFQERRELYKPRADSPLEQKLKAYRATRQSA